MLVVGVSSTSAHDFNRLVRIGSEAHVLLGDDRINFITSSEVAGQRAFNFKRCRTSNDILDGGPRVVVSTAAFHARARGSVPGLGGLKETKTVSSPSTCESQYCGEPP